MNAKWLSIISDCLILLGLICLGIGWQGNLSVTGALPFHSSTVQLTGSASGRYALMGVPSLLLGLVLMALSLGWMLWETLKSLVRRG
ncbi:MAG TPA: hypothetical protein VEK33_09800 [Terriglobales bacterium]|nr:hypothetical protein [Terriglobales bacterium]